MARRYRYRLAVLDKEKYATDQFEILNFNHGTQFHPYPWGVVDSNRAGISMIMEEAKEKRLMTIKKYTNGATVRFLNAHYKQQMFRALQFMIYKQHRRTKSLWSENVVEDRWYLEELYTMTDVYVIALNPRLKEELYGTVDNILLGIGGSMSRIGN